jgi:hypothetical protein
MLSIFLLTCLLFLLIFRSFSYILDTNLLSIKCMANIVDRFQFIVHLFTFFMGSFGKQKLSFGAQIPRTSECELVWR